MLNLKILTPEKSIFDEEVDKVVVPTDNGEIGILPGHINLMTNLAPGSLKITQKGKDTIMAVGDGLLQVHDNAVSLLTDLAKQPHEIDEKVVEEARKRAEQALEQKLSAEEYATTIAILEKSIAQLQVKRRHHSRSSHEPETIS